MNKSRAAIFGLVTSCAMAGLSGASPADPSAKPDAAPGAAKIADKDFGRLSADGVSAFNDIHLARVAIFDGKTDEAAKFVADAKLSLAKARTDDAIFVKAETALEPTAKDVHPAAKGDATGAGIAWIPIDSEIALGETFQSTPETAAAVVTARKGLEKGDGAKSLEAIRVAKIDVNYTVAVAPLDQSVAEVDEADKLIASHDYYGASQSLRKAEAGVRYDETDDVVNVKNRTSAARAGRQ
jgi:hypothetical protein